MNYYYQQINYNIPLFIEMLFRVQPINEVIIGLYIIDGKKKKNSHELHAMTPFNYKLRREM